LNRSNSLRVLTVLSLAFLLVSMSTDANAARRSALGGNQFIDDSKDMFAFPQLLLKYNNSAIFDFAPGPSYPSDDMMARGSVTFGDNWAWQFNTGRADFLDNTAFWAWGGFDRELDAFGLDDVQWWDVGVAKTFGDTPVGFNISWAADTDKVTPEGADPVLDLSESLLSFQLGADLLNANWAIEVGFGSSSDNLDDQNDTSLFELAVAARGNSFEAGGINWRWLAAFATYSSSPNADGIESDTMTAFRGNFGPVWGTPGDWLVSAYIYFDYLNAVEANDEAAKTLDSTREMSAQLLEEARIEAIRIGESARVSVAGEVEALKARRDFLESDVHHLETFLVDQRSRVREAASSLIDLADRVPGGLGDVRAPLLSASDDDDVDAMSVDGDTEFAELLIVTDVAAEDDGGEVVEVVEVVETTIESDPDRIVGLDNDPWADEVDRFGDPTEAIAVFRMEDNDESGPAVERDESGEEFHFSFDDEPS
jgi:hypothetical protein